VALLIAWLFLIAWDQGILNTWTKNWYWGPLGKPPASQQENKDKPKPPPEPASQPPR
jgi:hypothetical protein